MQIAVESQSTTIKRALFLMFLFVDMRVRHCAWAFFMGLLLKGVIGIKCLFYFTRRVVVRLSWHCVGISKLNPLVLDV